MLEKMCKVSLSKAEINWIVMALNHDLSALRMDYDSAGDGSPLQALSELAIDNRERLVRKLTDVSYKFTNPNTKVG